MTTRTFFIKKTFCKLIILLCLIFAVYSQKAHATSLIKVNLRVNGSLINATDLFSTVIQANNCNGGGAGVLENCPGILGRVIGSAISVNPITSYVAAAPASYTVGVQLAAGLTNLSNYNPSLTCTSFNGLSTGLPTNLSATSAQINVANNDTITCTATLTSALPTIKLAKTGYGLISLVTFNMNNTMPTAQTLLTALGLPVLAPSTLTVVDPTKPVTITEASVLGLYLLGNIAPGVSTQCVDLTNGNQIVAGVTVTYNGGFLLPILGASATVTLPANSLMYNHNYQCNLINTNSKSTISGTVFEDVTGDGLASGTITTGDQRPISGVTVRLWADTAHDGVLGKGDSFVASTTTNAAGVYSFTDQLANSYFVTVDAPTKNGGISTGILGEQTYASSNNLGIGNAGAISAFCDLNKNNAPVVRTTNGACYGGRQGAVADVPNSVNAEHVTYVGLSFSNISGVDFGFSFNVVSNVNDSGQGSLRQFITNANTINSINSSRFVPAVAMNQSNWWRITTASALPVITGSNVTIDGTAFSNTNGVTVLNTNSGSIAGATVGTQRYAIANFALPELEIVSSTMANTPIIQSTSPSLTISNVGINTSNNSSSYYIQYSSGSALGMSNVVAGYSMTGAPYGTYPAAAFNVSSVGGTGVISHSLFMGGGNNSVFSNTVSAVPGNWSVLGSMFDGINVMGTSSGIVFKDNYIRTGLSLNGSVGNHQVTNNSLDSTGVSGQRIAIGSSSNNTIRNNIITNSAGSAGLGISTGRANLISHNQFGGNNGNGIDLGNNGVSINTNGCVASGTGGANDNLARPVIENVVLTDDGLYLQGTVCAANTFNIEFYQASASNGDTGSDNKSAGEGTRYLGTLTSQVGGIFVGILDVTGISVDASSITAIAIGTSGATLNDTSEFSANVYVNGMNFGSVPDTYKTLLASGGAQHYITNGLSIGDYSPDSTDGSPVVPPANALGGDGIALPFPPLNAGTNSYSVVVKAYNLTDKPATLVGWIDFNRNGIFDVTEGVSITVPTGSNNTAFTLTWNNVLSLLNPNIALRNGPTYARFRLSNLVGLTTATPAGLIMSGEVEDYGGSGVIVIGSSGISGTVFSDINLNGILDSGEVGTGLTLYAKLINASNGVCAGNALQAIAITATTGAYILSGVSSGSYCVIISNDNVLTNVTPYTPPGWAYTLNSPGQLLITVTTGVNQPNQNFGLSNARVLSGIVFDDTGAGGGTAYNGVQDGTEAGLANTSVQLSYGSPVNTVTVQTNGRGQFHIAVPVSSGLVNVSLSALSGYVNVSKGVNGFTDIAAANLYNQITLDAATVTTAGSIRLGLAGVVRFLPDTAQSSGPGSIVFHAHTLTANSPGTVSFSYQNQVASGNNPNWHSVLFSDANCNGVIDSTDVAITVSIPLVKGSRQCVISKIAIPSTALPGDDYTQSLVANFNYGTTGVSSILTVHETTTLGDARSLQLLKTVNKTTAFPGDTLTYTIYYKSLEVKPITQLVIDDSTAAYSTYVANSAQCVAPIPTGVTCVVTAQPTANGTGAIVWTLNGNILSGVQGAVTYQIKVSGN